MKTITVKGIGNAKVRPDLVRISLNLETKSINYEKAMESAGRKIEEIKTCLLPLGFEKESVKTTDFRVSTDYETKKDNCGNYYRKFCGYVVYHRLKISFDFDTKMLSKVLSVISELLCQPELSVHFTVKDPSAVGELILEEAAVNARKKAEVLCRASGAGLGELISIQYNWGEVDFYSPTRYDMSQECCNAIYASDGANIDIEPDDIDASDTVSFVWQLVSN